MDFFDEIMKRKRTRTDAESASDFGVSCSVGDSADADLEYSHILLELPEDVCARLAPHTSTQRVTMLNAYLNHHLAQLPQQYQTKIREMSGEGANYRKFVQLKLALQDMMDAQQWGNN